MGLAQETLAMALEAARRQNARRILRMRLRVGDLSGVVIEALQFSLETVVEGTPAEGARIDIERVTPACICSACGCEYDLLSPPDAHLEGRAPGTVSKPVFGSARRLALPEKAEEISKGGRANLPARPPAGPGEPGFETVSSARPGARGSVPLQQEVSAAGIQSMLSYSYECPKCGTINSDLCRGKEMDLVSLEVD